MSATRIDMASIKRTSHRGSEIAQSRERRVARTRSYRINRALWRLLTERTSRPAHGTGAANQAGARLRGLQRWFEGVARANRKSTGNRAKAAAADRHWRPSADFA